MQSSTAGYFGIYDLAGVTALLTAAKTHVNFSTIAPEGQLAVNFRRYPEEVVEAFRALRITRGASDMCYLTRARQLVWSLAEDSELQRLHDARIAVDAIRPVFLNQANAPVLDVASDDAGKRPAQVGRELVDRLLGAGARGHVIVLHAVGAALAARARRQAIRVDGGRAPVQGRV